MNTTFEFADKFRFERKLNDTLNNSDEASAPGFKTGVIDIEKIISLLNKGSFAPNPDLYIMDKITTVLTNDGLLKDYLNNSKSKRPYDLHFVNDAVDKSFEEFYYKPLISTDSSRKINKRIAEYGYIVNPKSNLYKYRVLFAFINDVTDANSLASEYGLIIESDSYEGLELFLGEINLRFSETLKAEILSDFNNIRTKANNEKNKLDEFYEVVPQFVLENLSKDDLLGDLKVLLDGWVDEEGTNEELGVLKLIKSLWYISEKPYTFLGLLLQPFDNKTTILGQIIYRLDNKGGQFMLTEFMQFILPIWDNSIYKRGDLTLYNDVDGPECLPYRSDKTLGFYHSNVDASYENGMIYVKHETGDFTYTTKEYDNEGYTVQYEDAEEIVLDYQYHEYYPIELPKEQDGEIILSGSVPAFFLYIKENSDFWNNVYFGTELTIDILTTLSGFGNISKFRYLTKLAHRASKLKFATKAAKVAKTGSLIKATAGVVEITSGTVNAFLKLAELDKTELGQSISQYLFYLELLSLTGELSSLIETSIRNQTKKIVRQEKKFQERLNKAVDDGDLTQKEAREAQEFLRAQVQIVNSTKKTRKLPTITYADFGFAALFENTRFTLFYIYDLVKPKTRTLFFDGVEVFTGTQKEVDKIFEAAEVAFKADGPVGAKRYFNALGTDLIDKKLYSKSNPEYYIGKLKRDKHIFGGEIEYQYMFSDYQFGKRNWDDTYFNCSTRILDAAEKPYANIGKRKIFYADFYIPKQLSESIQANKSELTNISLGSAMLDDALAITVKDIGKDVDGIYGEWITSSAYAEYGGQSVNLRMLKDAMKGKEINRVNLEAAALKNFTGRWAKKNGFTKVEIITEADKYDKLEDIEQLSKLEVIFTKAE